VTIEIAHYMKSKPKWNGRSDFKTWH